MKFYHSIFSFFFLILTFTSCDKKTQLAETPDEFNRKSDSIISLMTLDEKIGQLVLFTSNWDVTGPTINNDYKRYIKEGKTGAVFNAFTAAYTKELQRIAVEETRLGIPLLFGYDVIHGHRTIFPIPLGESASWDLKAIEKSARIAATEASAEGIHWTFAPMVDISRDPRWGRVAEGAGEDTYLGVQIAKARVKGFQGDDLSATNTILACAKHYAAYGAAQAGRDYHTVNMSEDELRNVYLPPFKAAVDAGVATFMNSFNELNGVPATANEFLLKDILRKQWGFNGFVVTDYTSINEMVPHGYAEDEKHAGELAINAGVDMDMQGAVYLNYLKQSVEEGKVSEKTIDEAVRRILVMKYNLGLFDDPYKYSDETRQKNEVLTRENLEAARDVARKSMVLLKNDNKTLPLQRDKKIAIIGPLADDESSIIGNWAASGDRNGTAVSILEGFTEKIGKEYIIFEKGCDILSDDTSGFTRAVNAATMSDIGVMVMGEDQEMSGEAASRTELDLPGVQQELIKAIKETGKPIVLILMNGRPLTISWENENVDAILEAWFPGTMGGHAVADIVFGDYNPSGKLTMTFPIKVGQVPIHYNMKNTGRPINPDNLNEKYKSKYLDVSNEPLYPFGYGLSYTTFEYSNLMVSKDSISFDEEINIQVEVKNTGDVDGEEVVQLYVRDRVGSATRPVKELKGFEKIFLKEGESKKVSFKLSAADLKFYNSKMEFLAEPGDFDVFVGTSSVSTLTRSFNLVNKWSE